MQDWLICQLKVRMYCYVLTVGVTASLNCGTEMHVSRIRWHDQSLLSVIQ